MFVKKAENLILDSIFPIYCVSCGTFLASEKNTYLCTTCSTKIPINSGLFCPICFKRLNHSDNKKCLHSNKKSSLGFLGYATFYENSVIRDLIHNYKYRFAKKTKLSLANILIQYLKKLNLNNEYLIIPIPLHYSRFNWRGFNQSEEIGKIISEYFRWPIINNIIQRKKKTSEQAAIKTKEKRQENLQNAFVLNKKIDLNQIKNKSFILIDDVYTSGTTLEEAAKILKSAGVKKIIGLVVAK